MVDLTLRPAIHTKQRMKNVDSRKLMSVLLTLVRYRACIFAGIDWTISG